MNFSFLIVSDTLQIDEFLCVFFLKEENFYLSFMILGGVLQCFGNFGATFSEAFPPQKDPRCICDDC